MPKFKALCNLMAGKEHRYAKDQEFPASEEVGAKFVAAGLAVRIDEAPVSHESGSGEPGTPIPDMGAVTQSLEAPQSDGDGASDEGTEGDSEEGGQGRGGKRRGRNR